MSVSQSYDKARLITVLRQYFTYDITNSCTFKVNLEITMRVEKQPFFLLPVKGYRADLKINDSEGNDLIVLSDKEFEKLTAIPMRGIIELYLAKLKNDLDEKYYHLIEDYRVVAVLFGRAEDDYFEKVTVSWIERFENRKRDGRVSECVEIPIYLPRYGFQHGATSAIYLSIKTNSKYEIHPQVELNDLRLRKTPVHKIILHDNRHWIYRFSETPDPQFIEIKIRIGLPDAVKKWAHLGLASGTFMPSIILLLTIGFGKVPEFGFATIVGVIGFITGLRVLIFHDVDLMRRWNKILFSLIVFCAFLLLVLMFLSYFSDFKVLSAILNNVLEKLKDYFPSKI
jgi:hypothetical protein